MKEQLLQIGKKLEETIDSFREQLKELNEHTKDFDMEVLEKDVEIMELYERIDEKLTLLYVNK